VPMLCEYFSLEGLTQLMITIREVKKRFNQRLELTGIIITMYNGRLNLSAEVLRELKKYYSDKLFKTMIPRSVRLSEAPSYGEPIQYYDRKSKATEAYSDLVNELLARI
ncbi:MAG: ParA family protein, partial [Clostridia bacterium]|nr:ParA family protein [Clostridia bacterium]